jgi:hypothetical protein
VSGVQQQNRGIIYFSTVLFQINCFVTRDITEEKKVAEQIPSNSWISKQTMKVFGRDQKYILPR